MKRKDNLYNNMVDMNNIISTYNEICKKIGYAIHWQMK